MYKKVKPQTMTRGGDNADKLRKTWIKSILTTCPIKFQSKHKITKIGAILAYKEEFTLKAYIAVQVRKAD